MPLGGGAPGPRRTELARRADEISPTRHLRDLAARLVSIHPLRAADAFQLAAALVWTEEHPSDSGFVCLDARLCEAANREGFRVLPGDPRDAVHER